MNDTDKTLEQLLEELQEYGRPIVFKYEHTEGWACGVRREHHSKHVYRDGLTPAEAAQKLLHQLRHVLTVNQEQGG